LFPFSKVAPLEEKLLKIQDLYIDGDLSKEEYQKAKMRCQNLIVLFEKGNV